MESTAAAARASWALRTPREQRDTSEVGSNSLRSSDRAELNTQGTQIQLGLNVTTDKCHNTDRGLWLLALRRHGLLRWWRLWAQFCEYSRPDGLQSLIPCVRLLRLVAETAARKCGQTPPTILFVLLCDIPMSHHCSLRLHCLNFPMQAGTFWEPSHGFVNSSDGGRGHVNQVNSDLQKNAGLTHIPTPSSE